LIPLRPATGFSHKCREFIIKGNLFRPIDLSAEQIIRSEPEATPPAALTPAVADIATVTVDSANCRDKLRRNADKITVFYRDQELGVLRKDDDP
jgi:hypothetical protein